MPSAAAIMATTRRLMTPSFPCFSMFISEDDDDDDDDDASDDAIVFMFLHAYI